MIVAFASLFLGLVLGVQPVELAVGQGVASVELVLDGRSVGQAGGAPWTLSCDFGAALEPHRLEAIARNADGRELGRALQWINLPRPEAEGHVVFEGGEAGRGVVAHLTWESVSGDRPSEATVTFDGRPLAVSDPHRIELPPHDPDQLHFLHAELDFPSHLSAVVETAFGGAYSQHTDTELSAAAVELGERKELPAPDQLAGWFRALGQPLEPVAAETGPAEVVVVMDRAAQKGLWGLAQRWVPANGRVFGSAGTGPRARELLRSAMRLDRDQSLRFLWPFSLHRENGHVGYDLFARSEEHLPSDGGVYYLLAAARQPPFDLRRQRLADAVAVAGLSAAARDRRRAVVLVLSAEPADASRITPQAVRRYLTDLGVPLFVWSVEKSVSPQVEAAWGDVASVYSPAGLQRTRSRRCAMASSASASSGSGACTCRRRSRPGPRPATSGWCGEPPGRARDAGGLALGVASARRPARPAGARQAAPELDRELDRHPAGNSGRPGGLRRRRSRGPAGRSSGGHRPPRAPGSARGSPGGGRRPLRAAPRRAARGVGAGPLRRLQGLGAAAGRGPG